MKKIRKMVSKLWCILLCTLIVACSDSSDVPSPEPEPTPTEKDYELADNVIELEGDLLEHIISVDGNTLVYDSRTPNKEIPEVGEIILVSQVTGVFPYGFLGKVTKVSKEGNILVITETVALDEVFTYLDVQGVYELEPADVQNEGRNKKVFPFTDKFEIEVGSYIKGELEVNIKAILDIKLQIDKRNGKNVRSGYIDIHLENQEEVNVGLTYKILDQEGNERNPLGKGFKVGSIVAGPIIIAPTIQPYIASSFEGSINSGWIFETSSSAKYRMNFDGKGWSLPTNISKEEREWNFNVSPDLGISGMAYVGGGVALELRIYDNENIKAAINSQLGVEASGEISVNLNELNKGNEEEFYNQLADSQLALALKGGVGLEASAKIFFIEVGWEHPIAEKNFIELKNYVFPSFEQGTYKFEEGSIVASTQLARNLLWKQNVGLALYKGSECIESYSPVEYKFENDFKGQNPLRATFEGISKEELSAYSIWSYVKWGDLFIKCANLPMGGIEAVDLGLSVKWANCNLGASLPEDYGNYFAFGEVKPKTEYEEENWNNPRTTKLWGNNDAAYATWGKTWRMPTKADCEELLRECTWNLVDRGNIKGYEVVGKNGNSIFLPLTGSYSSVEGKNYEARYRTSEADIDEGGYDDPSTIVMELQKNFADTELDHAAGWGGHPIRPVEISLVGKWIREDCDCEPSCHYLFNENGSGYYSETTDGQVYKSEFTWDFDGKFLELIRKETDSVEDDGVDKFKIDFQSGSRFAKYSSDYDFEAIEINTVYFNKAQ